MKKTFYLICIVIRIISCSTTDRTYTVVDMSPAFATGEYPHLYCSPFETMYLSWTQNLDDTADALFFSKNTNTTWSSPALIAQGKDWFVNWADYPSITTFPGSELNILSYFLQKNSATTYDYTIRLALSQDGGERFRIIDSLHSSLSGEHGFVSLLPFSYDKVLTTWLDGSHMNAVSDTDVNSASHGHDHSGSMQLMSAFAHINGRISNRQVIDEKVCECCQTDLAMSNKGPIVVYRNRSDQEERDIYYSRYLNGIWSTPVPLFEDHWKIAGCPVNGPAITTKDNKVAVVYYTEAGGSPTVKLSTSANSGESFSTPITISTKYTAGRLDVQWINAEHLVVTYLDKEFKEAAEATIMMNQYNLAGKLVSKQSVDVISSKRKSGFPVIELFKENLFIAYTQFKNDSVPSIVVKQILLQ